MKIDTIVTLGENGNYYLVDETVQNGKKYFFASKVDENDLPLNESEIFEEVNNNNEYYLIPVKETETFNFLSAIFIDRFDKMVENEEDED